MVNLYTLPSWEILLFIVVSMVLFLVNSVLYYFLMPQAEFSHLGRKCLEGSSLILLLAVMAVFYEIFTDGRDGIVYAHGTDIWRWAAVLAGTLSALYWFRDRRARSLWILGASLLLWPVFDDILPWSLALSLAFLAWRLLRLFPETYGRYRQQLTARSI